MNTVSAIENRFSSRSFLSKELTDEQIEIILDAARYAPSPKNRQPWRFVVLRKEKKSSFLKLIHDSFTKGAVHKLYETKLNEFNSEEKSFNIMQEADTVILVFNAFPSYKVLGEEDYLFDYANIQSIGAAIENMILRATELEIGSLWICDIFASYRFICDYYKGQLMAAVALGYPADIKRSPLRKNIKDLLIDDEKYESNIIWVGPRESDIYDCNNFFSGSVTIFGSNCDGNISYCTKNKKRVDHNAPKSVENNFWSDAILDLKKLFPDSKILYYDSLFMNGLSEDLKKDVICCNSESLIQMLSDKINVRMIASNYVPVVPFQELTYDKNINLYGLFPNSDKIILQEKFSSGGYGTHIVNHNTEKSLDRFLGFTFMVSPYIENAISVNVHLIIGNDSILYFPGSIQITREINNKIIYIGADYITFQELSVTEKEKLRSYSLVLGEYLKKIGYRGVLGFDFLITHEEILFLEVNARFQASTPILNKALKSNGLQSIQEMQIDVFLNNKLPKQDKIDAIKVPYSMISYIEGTWDKPSLLEGDYANIPEVDSFFKDGFSLDDRIEKNAYLFKLIFNTNCTSISPDYRVNLYENLLDVKNDFYNAIILKRRLETKISLLNQGILISDNAQKRIAEFGKIRNAVFSAFDITIFDSLHINCPTSLKFSHFSPWKIDIDKNNLLILLYYGHEISKVTLDMEDIFGKNHIAADIQFSDVCFWATDRLRVHHTLSCCLKNQGEGCKFCEVTAGNRTIDIENILDVVDFYLKNANTFRHFLIGGGSEPRDKEYENILKIVKHIRKKSSKEIYVMTLPPRNLQVLKEYYDAGVTEIGFNIELFDRNAASKYMPGKSRISRDEYFEALKEAVRYWGNTGKVRSIVIAGLETEKSLLQGIHKLCEIGVMPIISVFRPIPGTATENIVPPSNLQLLKIYNEGTMICNQFSLYLGPKCPACQNNTLSLPL